MSETYVAPSRQGKKSLTVWTEPEFIDEVKIEAIRSKKTVQDFVIEAISEKMERGKKKR